jgi:hypothetical protein
MYNGLWISGELGTTTPCQVTYYSETHLTPRSHHNNICSSLRDWHPGLELLNLFHQIGGQKYDEQTAMYWDGPSTNPGLGEV